MRVMRLILPLTFLLFCAGALAAQTFEKVPEAQAKPAPAVAAAGAGVQRRVADRLAARAARGQRNQVAVDGVHEPVSTAGAMGPGAAAVIADLRRRRGGASKPAPCPWPTPTPKAMSRRS